MSTQGLTLLEQRRIEADVLRLVYGEMASRLGPDQALSIIGGAAEAAAGRAGAAFAASAGAGPSLKHFATVLDMLCAGGGLEASGVSLQGRCFQYQVDRCRYVEMYLGMGLSPELAFALSCRRDGAFAKGYHPGLHMDRSATIAQGSPFCRFKYTWPQQ